jgi:hypothetical protein
VVRCSREGGVMGREEEWDSGEKDLGEWDSEDSFLGEDSDEVDDALDAALFIEGTGFQASPPLPQTSNTRAPKHYKKQTHLFLFLLTLLLLLLLQISSSKSLSYESFSSSPQNIFCSLPFLLPLFLIIRIYNHAKQHKQNKRISPSLLASHVPSTTFLQYECIIPPNIFYHVLIISIISKKYILCGNTIKDNVQED